MARPNKESRQRILDNITIDDNGCWLMKPYKGCKGYAKVEESINGQRKTYRAHRYSYQAFNGEIPKGLQVCHSCDVRNCVNPEHLWLGTNQDNVNDMVKKGRHNFSGKKLIA
jgi:hypothetical protein